MDASWQECQANADQSICAHFEQYARQDYTHLGWRIGMRVWQPGMEREHGYLDGKSQEDQQENEQLKANRRAGRQNLYGSCQEMRREILHTCRCAARLEVKDQNSCEHKD